MKMSEAIKKIRILDFEILEVVMDELTADERQGIRESGKLDVERRFGVVNNVMFRNDGKGGRSRDRYEAALGRMIGVIVENSDDEIKSIIDACFSRCYKEGSGQGVWA